MGIGKRRAKFFGEKTKKARRDLKMELIVNKREHKVRASSSSKIAAGSKQRRKSVAFKKSARPIYK